MKGDEDGSVHERYNTDRRRRRRRKQETENKKSTMSRMLAPKVENLNEGDSEIAAKLKKRNMYVGS